MQSDPVSGSISTLSREDDAAMSSEDSSSTLADCDLGLGLSLAVGDEAACSEVLRPIPKIITAENLPHRFRSSLGTSTLRRVNGIAGIKRTADTVTPNASSQVVGWPPVRAYRMNSLSNLVKSTANKEVTSKSMQNNATNSARKMDSDCYKGFNHKQGLLLKSSYVKVNMDGVAIGRKVNLTSHDCYQKLACTLEKMFNVPIGSSVITGSSIVEYASLSGETISSKLLDGSTGYILTYEDKDGDWMLVGDVPWRMFLNSVRRLRIMRTC
ncbi:hypothetical protein SAY87_019325 [Trapa incisa]|uniref:Auxin-responsive protein n=1 Tax=Trapa incisa TaxID=236973 RepID=A0AAN7K4B0_9MYRT|nr:hypothetical protein SAY87_019325 [Trapa incisa]